LEAILFEKKAKTPCTSEFGRLMPPDAASYETRV